MSLTPGWDKAERNWPQNISDKGDCLNSVYLKSRYVIFKDEYNKKDYL